MSLILRKDWFIFSAILITASLIAIVLLVLFPFQSRGIGVPILTEEFEHAQKPSEQEKHFLDLPDRLKIPVINIDTKIQHVGLVSDGSGEMDVPSNFTEVGWYQHGVRPGMSGSAVIAGHLNGKNVSRAVFYDLDKLEIGDEIIILDTNQNELVFQVLKIESYPFEAPTTEVFLNDDGQKRLNLITCGGEWLSEDKSYDKRTVVFTELITETE
jgi:sortase A